MSDKELREAVEQALDWEPGIASKAVGVTAQDGVVTLTGHVPSYTEKREAEKVAGLVRGVKAVVCQLDVAVPQLFERSDEDIARAASNAIAWNPLLPKDAIQVCHGRVTLEGSVDWQYQRKAAGKCVRYLAGVRDVNNHIVVKSDADQLAVKTQIEAALFAVPSWTPTVSMSISMEITSFYPATSNPGWNAKLPSVPRGVRQASRTSTIC
ncbi:MAG TPA: BON domain-containing protein [Bryobacteraceae bacterium]|nr:BON domain-containing protein [Bryobacteraceae bacterium]